MTIEEAIVSVLLAAAPVKQLIGTRLYPTQAPQKATFPLVVYQEADQLSVMTHSGPKTLSRYTMDLTCWGTSYATAKGVAKRIKATLNGYRGTAGNGVRILGVFSQTEADDSEIPQHGDETGLFAVSMTLDLWFKTSSPAP